MLLFLVLTGNFALFRFLHSTCSYSSHPFLCALGLGLGLGFRLENKDQKKIEGTTVLFMANLDIPGNLTSLGLHCVLLN